MEVRFRRPLAPLAAGRVHTPAPPLCFWRMHSSRGQLLCFWSTGSLLGLSAAKRDRTRAGPTAQTCSSPLCPHRGGRGRSPQDSQVTTPPCGSIRPVSIAGGGCIGMGPVDCCPVGRRVGPGVVRRRPLFWSKRCDSGRTRSSYRRESRRSRAKSRPPVRRAHGIVGGHGLPAQAPPVQRPRGGWFLSCLRWRALAREAPLQATGGGLQTKRQDPPRCGQVLDDAPTARS